MLHSRRKIYGSDEYGKVMGEDKMMQEIWGPIKCGIAVPDGLENYISGVFEDKTGGVLSMTNQSLGGVLRMALSTDRENLTGYKFW